MDPSAKPLLVEVDNFPTPIAAELARAHLENGGIESVVFDGEIASSWVYTNALGGVRLMVAPADLEAARALLVQDDSVDGSVVSDAELISDNSPESPYCPHCHSKDAEIRKSAPRGWLSRWLNPGRALHCRACGHDWRG